MLAHEWRELEVLCERVSDLRHRYAAAQRTKNVGLLEGLKDDLVRARRQREMLVHHISACLSSATVAYSQRADEDDNNRPRADETASADNSATNFGFSDR